jgi:HlyD family secretion protein
MDKIISSVGPTRSFITRHPWSTAAVAIILAVIGFSYYKSKTSVPQINFADVQKGDVSQVVSVTGRVKPANDVELSFEKSGRVNAVYRGVGDRVTVWEPLVSLNSSELEAQLSQAEATVKAEQAKLDELNAGTRPEDINVSEVAVENAVNDLINSIRSGYVSADDSIHNKVDQFMTNPRS